jgi:hypothetical protein
MLLRHQGYWVSQSVKVKLTKEEKRAIGTASMPRLELDLVAYKGATNELLVVECKSFLDSTGVRYAAFDGTSELFAKKYKLFNSQAMRDIVFNRLTEQMVEVGACRRTPKVRLALAAGKILNDADRERLHTLFTRNSWVLFDEEWLREGLQNAANEGYENDVASVVSKLLLRNGKRVAKDKQWKLKPMPRQRELLPLKLSLSKDQFGVVKRGFVPREMEQKWLIRFDHSCLNFYRSWTGICVFKVRFDEDGKRVRVVEAWANRNRSQYNGADVGQEVRLIKNVLKTHFGVGGAA